MLCAGFHAAGLSRNIQIHILIRTIFTLAVICFSTPRRAPFRRLTGQASPLSFNTPFSVPRRLLIACLTHPICRSTHIFGVSQVDRMSMLFAITSPSFCCHEMSFSFRVACSTGGYLYSIGVALVNMLVDLDSSAQNSVFIVGSRVPIVSLLNRPLSYIYRWIRYTCTTLYHLAAGLVYYILQSRGLNIAEADRDPQSFSTLKPS